MIGFVAVAFGLFLLVAAFVVQPLVRHKKALASVLMICMLSLTALFYWQWGSGPGLITWLSGGKDQYVLRQQFDSLGSPDEVIQRLQQRAEAEPNNPTGWYLLGRLYVSQQQFAKAAGAYKKAVALTPEEPNYIYQYASALFFAGDKANIPQAKSLAEKAVQLQDHYTEAYNLLALIAYANSDYAEAAKQWQQILSYLPADDPARETFQQAVENLNEL